MNPELLLNELSLRPPAENKAAARARMRQLVQTVIAAVRAGARRSLRLSAPIDALALADQYLVAQWRNDPEVERELRQYFRSLETRSPLLADSDDPTLRDRALTCEFRVGKELADGLGVAHLMEGLAVSATSAAPWDRAEVALDFCSLDDDGTLSEQLIAVRHASEARHVQAHAEWLAGRDVPVRDGRELWTRRAQLFPSLEFCAAVEAELGELGGGPMLRQVAKRLGELERYFASWDGRAFEPRALPMKVTTEHEATLQQYAEERTFVCPDGTRRLFHWHARMTPGAWRLYFDPDSPSRHGIIGYIGKKPAGARYAT